ncbi:hypothetical protein BC332_13828 [Capsicum chinense]|nr:hypothetical protein BC332_13828 [Capsicum chinense]
MAYYTCNFPDIFSWIHNLPPISKWKTDSISVCISPSCSSQPSLKLSVAKNYQFCIVADYNLSISLWTSKPLKLRHNSTKLLDDESIFSLLINFVQDVLNYGPNKNSSFVLRLPRIDFNNSSFKEIFNFSFLTLAFIICIYETPADLRSTSIIALKNQFSCPQSRQASKLLVKILGSNIEEQWMRSVNLAITNWIVEINNSSNHPMKTPCTLFSYSFSTQGLWKVQLYCPIIAMDVETYTSSLSDDNLRFSLNFHQLEGVIQLNHKVIVHKKWIEVMVNTDNIRCDVVRLVNESLMSERGAGISEKHFPSRISLQLTPTLQSNVLSISVNKSSDNPLREIGMEKTIEAGFDPPNTYMGLKVSAGETVVTSMKPWKFEQSANGDGANLNWFLHDSGNGREVFSSKPSVFSLIQPKAWFKNRYSSVYRPFTKQGGVIFAGDEYGESVCWKVDKRAIGKTMEWELKEDKEEDAAHLFQHYDWIKEIRTAMRDCLGVQFRQRGYRRLHKWRTVLEDLREKFDKVNSSRAFYLHKEIVTLVQGTSVSGYFSRLRELWDEMEALVPHPSCACPESKENTTHFQMQKLWKFLIVLNKPYAHVKSQALVTTPVPAINEAYAMIINVESQRLNCHDPNQGLAVIGISSSPRATDTPLTLPQEHNKSKQVKPSKVVREIDKSNAS